MKIFFLFALLGFGPSVWARAPIVTNSVRMLEAPEWLTESRLNSITRAMENRLEWDIRRITATWYLSDADFKRGIPGAGDTILAYTRTSDQSVHLGPRVTSEKFDRVFGHELVHVILQQKYKGAIPPWLQEGMANFHAKFGSPDYGWLAQQPKVPVAMLSHPLKSVNIRYHYDASTAVVEMIAARCAISDLMQLSVGKKLETYLGTYCGIKDVDAEFATWVQRKAAKPQ